jgi:hypothetical protein
MHPQVSDGGVGFQIYWVPVCTLNKRSCTADKGCSSNLGVWLEANDSSSFKKELVKKCYTGYQTWADSLEQCNQGKIDFYRAGVVTREVLCHV